MSMRGPKRDLAYLFALETERIAFVDNGNEWIDEFALYSRLEYVWSLRSCFEADKSELFGRLSAQRQVDGLSEIDVATDRCVPSAGLYVFVVGSFLKQQRTVGRENVEMNHRVEQHRPRVAMATRGRTNDTAFGVYKWKKFVVSHYS